MVISLIGGYLVFNKVDYHWALIKQSLSVFDIRTYFTLKRCACTLGPISLIGLEVAIMYGHVWVRPHSVDQQRHHAY
jgi:hypothetical protein